MYLQKKNIQMGKDIDLVSFVDYSSNFYELYSNSMDCIIQPVEELGTAAGEQILKRIETPESPVLEQMLSSSYRPHTHPQSWNHSDR